VESWEQTLADLFIGGGAALKRHAFLLCGDEAQADDLVQEALVRAFTRLLRVPRPGAAEARMCGRSW
jgi:DNA-directed RNA polymerase specialized sigma24 family protein